MSDRTKTTDAEVDRFFDAVEQENSLGGIVDLLIQRNRAIAEMKHRVTARAEPAVDAADKLVESTAALEAILSGVPSGPAGE
jgi:hypothetical protein